MIAAAGVDWAGLTQQMRTGRLPHLQRLAERGASGWLRSAPPREGPSAWAGLATGQLPEVHQVAASEEGWSGGQRPLSLASWRAPPIWATLQAAGVETASVDWPGARAGAAQAGVHIDQDFAEPAGATPGLWSLPRHCAPKDVRTALRDVRTHPTQITGGMLRPLVPELAAVDQRRDTALPRLAGAMARAATVQAAAAWVLENSKAEAVFVHHGWLGEVCAVFDAAQTGPFAKVVEGAWRFLDGLVGRLIELAGPDARILVVSPGRYTGLAAVIAGGRGVEPGPLAQADILDIAPSVLAAFGLTDPGLPGRPIAQLAPERLERTVSPPAPPPAQAPDLGPVAELVREGYAPPKLDNRAPRAGGLAELALAVAPREPAGAIWLADQALAIEPENRLALAVKVMAYVILEESEPLEALAETLMRVAPERGWGALAHAARYLMKGAPDAAFPWLRRAQLDRRPQFLLRVAALWFAAGRPSEAARLFKLVAKLTPGDPAAHIGVGMAALAARNYPTAEAALREALRLDPSRPTTYLQIAQLQALTGRSAEAQRMAAAARVLGAEPALADAAQQGRLED
jgi:hypothetical protein